MAQSGSSLRRINPVALGRKADIISSRLPGGRHREWSAGSG